MNDERLYIILKLDPLFIHNLNIHRMIQGRITIDIDIRDKHTQIYP